MTSYTKGVASIKATITDADSGGFTAIASTGELDRDGEIVAPGAFLPLPASVPVHIDHTGSVATLVARARPYYSGTQLLIEATFSSTPDAQVIRQKMAEGVIDSISVMFMAHTWENRDGIKTLVKGELIAADLVSIPSNRGARVLSVRGYGPPSVLNARQVAADAACLLARVEVAEAKRVLKSLGMPGRYRQSIDGLLADTFGTQTTSQTIDRFLKEL